MLLVALALGVHGPGSAVAVSAAPAILAGAYLLVVSRPADAGVAWVPPARSAAAVVTGAVVVVVALAVGSQLAPGHQPGARSTCAPRSARPSTWAPRPTPSTSSPGAAPSPDDGVFSARVDQAWLASPTDWRLVSLDVFDGGGWTTDARATRRGPSCRHRGWTPRAWARRAPIRSADRLAGPWVPTTGVPTGVRPADLAYDPATSILVGVGDARADLHPHQPAPGADTCRPSTGPASPSAPPTPP